MHKEFYFLIDKKCDHPYLWKIRTLHPSSQPQWVLGQYSLPLSFLQAPANLSASHDPPSHEIPPSIQECNHPCEYGWMVCRRVGNTFSTSHEVSLSPPWILGVHIECSSRNLGWSTNLVWAWKFLIHPSRMLHEKHQKSQSNHLYKKVIVIILLVL